MKRGFIVQFTILRKDKDRVLKLVENNKDIIVRGILTKVDINFVI